MKTSKINIPIILEFRDYHDIDFFGSDLQRIIPLIRWKEIDFDRGNYLAIYYFNIKEANEFLLNNEFKPPVNEMILGAFGGSLDKNELPRH